jgi:hypothetical protein
MPINTIPISNRTAPYSNQVNANGSYTLPQQGFVPAQGTRPLAEYGGQVPDAVSGHTGNPGFIMAGHVDASWLPGLVLGRATGIMSQTAQIQMNTSIFANS